MNTVDDCSLSEAKGAKSALPTSFAVCDVEIARIEQWRLWPHTRRPQTDAYRLLRALRVESC